MQGLCAWVLVSYTATNQINIVLKTFERFNNLPRTALKVMDCVTCHAGDYNALDAVSYTATKQVNIVSEALDRSVVSYTAANMVNGVEVLTQHLRAGGYVPGMWVHGL